MDLRCRGAIAKETLFAAAAFDPSEAEVAEITGAPTDLDAAIEDLPGAEDLGLHQPKIKQKNTRIILDSDDEEEEAENKAKLQGTFVEELSEKKVGKQKEKKPKKAKKEDEGAESWATVQEPSTKMIWLADEIDRCAVE